jgi:hypothetical protein
MRAMRSSIFAKSSIEIVLLIAAGEGGVAAVRVASFPATAALR